MLFRDHQGCERMALIYSIPWYYLIFCSVVDPHEYYLLVLVPFASVIAGRGAHWVEERIQNDFRIQSNHVLSATIGLGTAICSVFIFSVNFIAALDLEQRSAAVEKEMRGVLEQGQGAQVYVDRANFPIEDYVVYNRTAKLMYFAGLLSKEQIRMRSEPVRPSVLMNALRQYGRAELVVPGAMPQVDVEKIQMRYRHLRYLMFYRFTEESKAKIKNQIKTHKLIYDSVNWLVYDLASE